MIKLWPPTLGKRNCKSEGANFQILFERKSEEGSDQVLKNFSKM